MKWHTATAMILAAGCLAFSPGKEAGGSEWLPAFAAESKQHFTAHVRPFLDTYCVRCHHAEERTSGVRVDHLDGTLDDRQLKLWEHIRDQVAERAMPPEEEQAPSSAERQRVVQWIEQFLAQARLQPSPKNGLVRRLTVAQYRNTLRELLLLEDELADILPADAVSREGFVNNQETLLLSPLLLEAYLEIAEQALARTIVDPAAKPVIQNFRVDLGRSINPEPCPDKLILGAGSLLLANQDVLVRPLIPEKAFPFEPFVMQTRYRFEEGYRGNATVRGWRDFDSIYHAVFACMRGSTGYPKGLAYSTVPEGLLLRPAIPSVEQFRVESTFGPKANFKISLRELPDQGRFRVSITAAKYRDGLLLETSDPAQPPTDPAAIVLRELESSPTLVVPRAGVYQIDAYRATSPFAKPEPDPSRLTEGLLGHWTFDGNLANSQPAGVDRQPSQFQGGAGYAASPLGQALSLQGNEDRAIISGGVSPGSVKGFTIALWIHPEQLRSSRLVAQRGEGRKDAWRLEMPSNQGVLQFETVGKDQSSLGVITTPVGAVVHRGWQHVAIVARRGRKQAAIYINGRLMARGTIPLAELDQPLSALQLGGDSEIDSFRGKLDELRIYRRALGEAELQALVDVGRDWLVEAAGDKPQELALVLGDREFVATLRKPAFLAVRLEQGELPIQVRYPGGVPLDQLVLTPLAEEHPIAQRFAAMEQRSPHLGVYLGLRRDCGSTLTPVQAPQVVDSHEGRRYVFEGAIGNFPAPEVESNNVNYLAGVREIGVRSEYTDGRDMPRLLIQAVEFEGPFYESWPPPSHRNIFFESSLSEEDPTAYAAQIIRRFAARAYRRPLSDSEFASLFAVFEQSAKAGLTFEESIRDALQVVLTSPQFLFLIENSRTPAPEPISGDELASKLAYFLWNGPPDHSLLEAADSRSLRSRLDQEITRMIADRRFARFLEEFVPQWLGLDKFAVLEVDRQRFPQLTRDAKHHLKEEPVRLVEYLIRHNLSVSHLIESDFIVANEVVASYYGLGDKIESGLAFEPLFHRRRDLGGVLTQAAVLAGLSDGREPNPVKRGAWLARKIIAEPPEDPPPNVPALKEATEGLSLRQRLEVHRNQAGCAQCHAKIDPWGIPFEEFDAAGRFRQEAVDARSTLPDKSNVAGVNDLKRYLSQERLDQVAFSVAKHLAIYATGRNLSYYELDYLRRELPRLSQDGYRLQDMLRFVVHSPIFLEK
jgi:hypothetical protein